jgi:hypothetical protein
MAEVVVNFDWVYSEEKFSGKKCFACGDKIFGIGFRMTIATSTNKGMLPSFKDTDIVICKPCHENGVKW